MTDDPYETDGPDYENADPRERIEIVEDPDPEMWNECLGRSPHANPLHRYEAIDVLERYSNATAYPLVGYEGGDPIGVFPAFEVTKAGVPSVFSPPPYLWVQYLGPAVVNDDELDPQAFEARHLGFVEACLDWLEAEVGPRYVHVHTDPDYADPRPFEVNDFETRPRYTYTVDLTLDRDDLLMTFGSDARSNVRSGKDVEYEVREGDADDAAWIIEQVRERYEEQGKSYGLQPGMVRELHERLPDGLIRPYVCSVRGDPAGGMVALDDGETIYRWQGGAKTDGDVPVNDLLDWHITCDAMDRGVEQYDLVGAENERINKYKSKFNPELSAYYTLERSSKPMRLAAGLYDQLGKLK
jgi:hypothetical protein